jgi:Na+/melibiose symporter-like transporter
MEKKNSGMSTVLTGLLVIVIIVRIVMIMGRKSSNSAHQTWDNTYLIWSVFFLCAIIGSFFWSRRKKE